MPYVFDQVNQELDPNKKQDIFGQGNTPQGSNQTGAPPQDGVQKTDTSQAITQAGSSSGQPNSSGQASPDDRQKVLNLQSQRQQAPKITEKLGQDLSKSKTDLQAEANNYVQGYQDKDYREGVSKEAIGKAIQGDEQAYNQAYGRAFKQNYGNVDQFAPKTQTEFEGVRDLESSGGIKNLFKREMGPQYKDTEAAFDTMLLARNPEFRRIQQELSRQQQELINEREAEKVARTQTAQGLADTGFYKASQDIKTDLGGYQTDLENPLRAKEAAEEAARAQLDREQLAREYEQAQIAALRGDFGAGDSFMQRAARQLGGIDPNQYVDIDKDVDWREFASSGDAAQFNRIMALLGGKDSLQEGRGPGDAVLYNQQGIRDALTQEAVGERRGLEDQYKRDMAHIMSAGDTRVQQTLGLRGRDVGDFYRPAAQSLAGEYNLSGDVFNNKQGGVKELAFKSALADLDANKFYKKAGANTALDYLDQGQIDRLNQLAAETGQAQSYALGQSQKEDQFDRDAYLKALRDMANSRLGGGAGEDYSDKGRQDRTINYWKERAAAGDKWAGDSIGKAADAGNEYARSVRDDLASGRYGDAAINAIPGGRQIYNSVSNIGGGGKIICTEYYRLGWLPKNILDADLEYQRRHTPVETIKNYLAWAQYVVPVIRKNRLARYAYWPIARSWAYQMAYRMKVVKNPPLFGFLFETVFLFVSNKLGSYIRKRRKKMAAMGVA